MGMCLLCQESVEDRDALDHLRLIHPAEYGDGLERWPDGGAVIYDQTEPTFTPFKGPTAWSCSACAMLVADPDKHAQWHRETF